MRVLRTKALWLAVIGAGVLYWCLALSSYADTIYFKDGSFLRCKVHDEPVVFPQKKHPRFVEIEIPYGVIGFYLGEHIVKVEKDDLYSPDERSMSLVRIMNLLGTSPADLIALGDTGETIQGVRELKVEVQQVTGWAFSRQGQRRVALAAGQEIPADSLISVTRNGRLKIRFRDSETPTVDQIVAGLLSETTAEIQQNHFEEQSKTNILSVALDAGKIWVDALDRLSQGRRTELFVAPIRVRSETSTYYVQLLENKTVKVALLRGAELSIKWKDHPTEYAIEPGRYAVFGEDTRMRLEEGRVAPEEFREWTDWDSWEALKVEVPLSILVPSMVSFPSEGPEIVSVRSEEAWRSLRANQPLKTESFQRKLQRIREAIEMYKTDIGELPTMEQGLHVLLTSPGNPSWKGPYLPEDETFDDFWGRPLIYQIWTDVDGTPIPDVRSAGINGKDELGLGDDLR